MYGYERCTIKKAECQRIDAFELWCWRRVLRVPWTARRSNQSIIKEISPEFSLEGLMLKLQLQYFCYLMWRTDSFEKTLMLGKIEVRRRRGQEDEMVGWHHWLDGHEFEQAPRVGDGQGSLVCCSPWGRKELDMTEWLNWTEKEIPFPNTQPLATISVFLHVQRSYSGYFLSVESHHMWSCVWLLSFSMMFLKSSPVVTWIKTSLFLWDFHYGLVNEDRAFFPCVLWGHCSESPWIWTPTNTSPLFWSWENARKNNFRTFDLRNTRHQKFQLETNKSAYTPVKEPGWRNTCFHSEQNRSG